MFFLLNDPIARHLSAPEDVSRALLTSSLYGPRRSCLGATPLLMSHRLRFPRSSQPAPCQDHWDQDEDRLPSMASAVRGQIDTWGLAFAASELRRSVAMPATTRAGKAADRT